MAILNILREGEETLRKKSRPVEVINPRVLRLLDDMKDTLKKAEGVGLAAPQVGVLRRIFVVDTGERTVEFINPVIVQEEGVQVGTEGCLSCPGKYGIVSRPMRTKVKALDRNGNEFVFEGEELISRALCHEYDHLDGVLYVDKASEIFSADARDQGMMRIVFMGTPAFAAEALRALCEDGGHDVALVVTNPDKPSGRGHKLTPPPVKDYALSRGIEVFQPLTLRDESARETLRAVGADVFIVAAYGKLLPPEILALPPLGCVNIHASLLPRWRGAAPINRAVMAGDAVGGVTVMYMAEGLDTGDMILKKELPIPPQMTAGEYHDRLAVLGGEAINEYLALAASGTVPREKQDDASATYAAKLTDDDRRLDFAAAAQAVCNRIRGLSPLPGAYCFYGGKRLKLLAAVPADGSGRPGEILGAGNGAITVACGSGAVAVTALQAEGKPKTDADSYLRGNRVEKGSFFTCS